jgi:predicted nucleic acid-binding protein
VVTAIDTTVLADVALARNVAFAQDSLVALTKALAAGDVVVGEVVVAEVRQTIRTDQLQQLLSQFKIKFVPTSMDAALRAGEMMKRYRAAGGTRSRVIADFLVGAHALEHADRLLTRDQGFARACFDGLPLVIP